MKCKCEKRRALLLGVILTLCLMTACSKNEGNEVLLTNTPEETFSSEATIEPTDDPKELWTEVPIADTEQEEKVEASNGESSESSEETKSKEPSEGVFDPWFEAETSIAYSSGTESDWSYGNQRKEFTVEKPCYVRIGSSIAAIWHHGWRYGEGNAITITYRFTGVENCKIEVADGFVAEQQSDDPNIMVFSRVITAKSVHSEDVVVFRYEPIQVGSISLEVIYDDQIKSQFDKRNTIYFVESEW